ncbi:hypothetical protein SASPL_152688 [Salvia splendens]|uniref:Late embryogenesis abundant protein LEA-2 subgroup domain-containing protein n=1 Tax=Salvia splendens TaxID=180675 RepID=A0A8X8W4D1_SALSN|nr:uncharacterized protein LOC121783590 [Salvia splendens]KAG6387496.1 hypothetical protein SASPL_152688 [Salvia splendens]
MDPPPPLPLPPPPPYTPANHIVLPKQARHHDHIPKQPILRRPRRRTNPMVWLGAVLCLVFSLLLIFFGITTLIIFVGIKPQSPVLDIPAATLSVIYFDSPQFLNGDITFLANFTNPNRKLGVKFEYLNVELYFSGSLIASEVVEPFRQRAGEVRLIQVHLLSSLVYLQPNLAIRLLKQEQRNRVVYEIKANFRVKFEVGVVHYSYALHGNCVIEMTSPPNGALITRHCTTKR